MRVSPARRCSPAITWLVMRRVAIVYPAPDGTAVRSATANQSPSGPRARSVELISSCRSPGNRTPSTWCRNPAWPNTISGAISP